MPLKPVISCRRVDQAKRIHQFLQSASKGGSALLDPPYNAYLQSNWPDCPCMASGQGGKCEFTSVNVHFPTQTWRHTGVSWPMTATQLLLTP